MFFHIEFAFISNNSKRIKPFFFVGTRKKIRSFVRNGQEKINRLISRSIDIDQFDLLLFGLVVFVCVYV